MGVVKNITWAGKTSKTSMDCGRNTGDDARKAESDKRESKVLDT